SSSSLVVLLETRATRLIVLGTVVAAGAGALLEQTHASALPADLLIEIVRVVVVVPSVGSEHKTATRLLRRFLGGRPLLLLDVLVGSATLRLGCSSLLL
ncbi:hypothetical protein PMAYCL1PPCAC_05506, partial [Pristionchus mayeri]